VAAPERFYKRFNAINGPSSTLVKKFSGFCLSLRRIGQVNESKGFLCCFCIDWHRESAYKKKALVGWQVSLRASLSLLNSPRSISINCLAAERDFMKHLRRPAVSGYWNLSILSLLRRRSHRLLFQESRKLVSWNFRSGKKQLIRIN